MAEPPNPTLEPLPQEELKLTVGETETILDKFFHIEVVGPDLTWHIARRYSQFYELFEKISSQLDKETIALFPSKTLITDKLEKQVVEKRQKQLQLWLDAISKISSIATGEPFRVFLNPNEKPAAKFLVDAHKKGWVQKLGEYTGALYHKRYLILQGNKLFYYKTEMSSEPSGVIELELAKIEARKDTTFEITTGGTTFIFKTPTNEECFQWVIELRQSRIRSDAMNDNYLKYCDSVISMPDSTDDELDREQKAKLLDFLIQPTYYGSSRMQRKKRSTIGRWSTSEIEGPITEPTERDRGSLKLEIIEEDMPTNIEYKTLEDGTTRVKAANLAKIIEKLVDWRFGDTEYITTVLYTYNSFTTADRLLEALIALFQSPPKRRVISGELSSSALTAVEDIDALRARILVVLSKWIELHFDDFVENTDLTARLLGFIEEGIEGEGIIAGATKQLLIQVQNKNSRSSDPVETDLKDAPMPILPTLFAPGTFDFYDLHPVEVARQLTLNVWGMFKAIPLREFLNQGWNKKQESQVIAPHLSRSIAYFNLVSQWVGSVVVRGRTPTQRAALLERFIDIAVECRKLQNFESLIQISAGLQNSAVYRLQKSWELLKPESKTKFDQIASLLDSGSNFERYRSAINQAVVPAVPYIGLYLSDLTFIEDGNPAVLGPNNLLNFDKRYLLAKVIGEIQRLQSGKYIYRPIPQIQTYLFNLTVIDRDELYKLSLEREPRAKAQPQQ